MHLAEMLSLEWLEAEVAAGYVRANTHGDLTIYNYAEKAQFERRWNEITTRCRGLIVDSDGNVLARPFPKFFNHDEPEAPQLTGPIKVVDKLDGSLGIAYIADGTVRIATRGSFTSDQAIRATEILRTKYHGWLPPEGYTVLFEIIYPENRIVVDYGNMTDLVLLGAIRIVDGHEAPTRFIHWTGPRATEFAAASVQEALAARPRKNAEGYVITDLETGERIKIKQADYVRLHRIVTGWNERTVWEHLAAGKSIEELVEGLPDEFHHWATETALYLTRQRQGFEFRAECAFTGITVELPEAWTRREFAEEAKKYPTLCPALFQLLDKRPITEWAWKQVRPTSQKEATLG